MIVGIIEDLLTPQDLLKDPLIVEIIDTERYPNFNSLLVQRERIRRLELLPAKSQIDHEQYHKVRDSGILLSNLLKRMGDDEVFVDRNQYPYDLPRDVEQLIIWYRPDVSRDLIKMAVRLQLVMQDLRPSDAISFERSSKFTKPFVRSSFPHVNHLHLWLPKF